MEDQSPVTPKADVVASLQSQLDVAKAQIPQASSAVEVNGLNTKIAGLQAHVDELKTVAPSESNPTGDLPTEAQLTEQIQSNPQAAIDFHSFFTSILTKLGHLPGLPANTEVAPTNLADVMGSD